METVATTEAARIGKIMLKKIKVEQVLGCIDPGFDRETNITGAGIVVVKQKTVRTRKCGCGPTI